MTTTTAFIDIVDDITIDTLRELCAAPGPCVSAYLPTRRAQPDPAHDGLVLRGLLDRAACELSALPLPAGDIDTILDPLRELVIDRKFWGTQAEALALFATADGPRVLRLPARAETSVRAGWRAHVVPLIPIATEDRSFHVLAFSRSRVRLFDGTRDALVERPLGSIPGSIEEMERRHQRERELQHQHMPRRRGVASFHGHGGPSVKDRALRSFVKEVADGVRREIGAATTRPLVLAAVAEHLPLFRATATLPMLLDQAAEGSPDTSSPVELLRSAWPIVEERLARRHADLIGHARAALANRLATSDPVAILQAAAEGRIDTLVIGSLDAWAPAPLIDHAVCAALSTGAAVHLDDGPDALPTLAILRH